MDINELLKANEDELFVHLGTFLSQDHERGIGDLAKLSRKGRIWFDTNKQQLANLICSKYDYLKSKNHADTALEIAAIIGDYFTGVPALIVAVLVLKTGLKSLCKKRRFQFRSLLKSKRRKKHE